MCTVLSLDLYCTNFKCPHNLFWEELSLDRERMQITDKALEIRNCCCKITRPWTPEEISDAWGLTKEEIGRSEEEAFRKLQKKIRINRKRALSTSILNKELAVWTKLDLLITNPSFFEPIPYFKTIVVLILFWFILVRFEMIYFMSA